MKKNNIISHIYRIFTGRFFWFSKKPQLSFHTHIKIHKRKKQKDFIQENFKVMACALALAIVFRSFLFEPFHIPSSSMYPTLIEGDYIFVSKFSYGYSKYSFPFGIPFFKGRIFEKKPERGDVIVFRYPENPRINYIKRVVGLPGDKIQMKNGFLYVNDVKVPKIYEGDFTLPKPVKTPFAELNKAPMYKETLPNGKTYGVLDMFDIEQDNTKVYEVPQNYYFFLGDNRDNSQDSRFMKNNGYVSAENLVGKADVIFFSSSEPLWKIWKFYKTLRFKRFFNGVD